LDAWLEIDVAGGRHVRGVRRTRRLRRIPPRTGQLP
jgi:hypothetical protein